MKKIIAILFVLFLLPSMVHAKFIEFMGIPIAGTIYDFKAKLQKKGLKYSGGSEDLGTWYFKGLFTGRQSEIIVSFDTKTKRVHSCSVNLKSCYKKEEAISDWEYYKELLLEKYSDMAIANEGNAWSIEKNEFVTVDDTDVPRYFLLTFYENYNTNRYISYGSIELILEVFSELGSDAEVYQLIIEYGKNKKYSVEDVIEDL